MKKVIILILLFVIMFSIAFAQTISSRSSDGRVEVTWESQVSAARPWINVRIVNNNNYDIIAMLDIVFANGNTRMIEVTCPANALKTHRVLAVTTQISDIKVTYRRFNL
jgi:hypothetical protein